MTREEFSAQVTAALNNAIANKLLDAWFFNDFDCKWAGKDNCEINKVLNAVIPGDWRIIDISGNCTNVGLGIFYEKNYDMYLELACYDEDYEEFIDDFELYTDFPPYKFDDEALARISHIKEV